MGAPPCPPGCPPGIEYFTMLDHIWVMEKLQLIEVVTNWEANQRWQCLNNAGLQVYWAQEKTDCCSRQCCCSYRAFTIDCFDPIGRPVIKLTRPLRCNSAWSCILPLNCCCLQTMQVHDLNGNLIGRVRQNWALFHPTFELCDEDGKVLLTIAGPCCTSPCFGDVNFDIIGTKNDGSNHKGVIGSLTKKWGGIVREVFLPGNADTFACVFPMELGWKPKLLIYSATFLIDFMFFEDRGRERRKKEGLVAAR